MGGTANKKGARLKSSLFRDTFRGLFVAARPSFERRRFLYQRCTIVLKFRSKRVRRDNTARLKLGPLSFPQRPRLLLVVADTGIQARCPQLPAASKCTGTIKSCAREKKNCATRGAPRRPSRHWGPRTDWLPPALSGRVATPTRRRRGPGGRSSWRLRTAGAWHFL